jgi:hypothetical protein
MIVVIQCAASTRSDAGHLAGPVLLHARLISGNHKQEADRVC